MGIETSTPVCSVALADSDRVMAEYTLDIGVHHSERLLPMVQAILEGSGLQTSDLDGVSVAAGPGSFTGLRIGMSTAKGLCMASRLPLLTVSTLEGLALGAAFAGMPVCAILDARRGEVYAGLYRLEGGRLAPLAPEAAVRLEDLLPDLPRPTLFVGDGASAYQDSILETLDGDARFISRPFSLPRAASIALLGRARLERGEVTDLSEAEPCYLRRSQAERVREERLRRTGR